MYERIARALVAGAIAACVAFYAMSVLDCMRGATFAALNYSMSQRFTLIGVHRDAGRVIVFDTATGALILRPLPEGL